MKSIFQFVPNIHEFIIIYKLLEEMKKKWKNS